MTHIIKVPPPIIENNKNNKYCLEYFRKDFENFTGTDTNNYNYNVYEIDEQIERYSKNLAFWYLQLDKCKQTNGNNKLIKIKFIKEQILRIINTSKTIFPDDVPSLVNEKAMLLKQLHS